MNEVIKKPEVCLQHIWEYYSSGGGTNIQSYTQYQCKNCGEFIKVIREA